MKGEDMGHIVLDSEETLAKAMSDIMQTRKAVIVTKNGDYFGMIDSGNLRSISDDPNTLKAGHMAVSAPTVTGETTLLETCKLFFSSRMKALPMLAGKKVVGVMTFSELLNRLADERVLDRHRVSEVMSRPGVRIDEASTVAQAQALMRKSHVRRLIVTKEGLLSGMLSASDIAKVLLKPKEKTPLLRQSVGGKDVPIAPLMQRQVATVSQEEGLAAAARKMTAMGVASLVVVDGEVPVGVVTAHDMLEPVFATEEPSVHISGLYGEHKSLFPEIMDAAKKEIGKLERSKDVNYLSLHFKFDKKLCTVKARLEMKGIINASASDYSPLDAVRAVLKELDKMTARQKKNRMHER